MRLWLMRLSGDIVIIRAETEEEARRWAKQEYPTAMGRPDMMTPKLLDAEGEAGIVTSFLA